MIWFLFQDCFSRNLDMRERKLCPGVYGQFVYGSSITDGTICTFTYWVNIFYGGAKSLKFSMFDILYQLTSVD